MAGRGCCWAVSLEGNAGASFSWPHRRRRSPGSVHCDGLEDGLSAPGEPDHKLGPWAGSGQELPAVKPNLLSNDTRGVVATKQNEVVFEGQERHLSRVTTALWLSFERKKGWWGSLKTYKNILKGLGSHAAWVPNLALPP